MKFATLKDGTRDGALVVVSRDLKYCVAAPAIAPTLQSALDDWHRLEPRLQEIYRMLNNGELGNANRFDTLNPASPLPRAFQWADGSAYVNHVELVRRARGAELPPSFWTDPLMYQGGSDGFIGPNDDILVTSEDYGIDLEAEVAVITDDVPMAISAAQAGQHIRLLMLVNDVSLRNLIPAELTKGFGFFHGKPATAFSPVAVTPDELGEAWDGEKLHLPLRVDVNEQPFGRADAGQDMTFSFPQLIAHAAKTRHLGAGTIIGSGTVSNKDPDGSPGRPVAEGGRGYSCVAELRMIEQISSGAAETPFLHFGDRVRIEMLDDNGASVFGAIEQAVVRYTPPQAE